MEPRFHLQLLGGHRLRDLAQRERVLPSRRATALLACVAVERRVPRVALAERLWPAIDLAAARRNLRRELARLRECGLHELLDAGPDEISVGPVLRSDLDGFIAASERGDGAAALLAWGGPLLQGFVLAEAPAFDAWLDQQRAELMQRWRRTALAHAEQLEREGALREALVWYDRLRADDPLQERHYVSAMRLHHRLGETEAALQVYASCQNVLRTELGVAPSAAAAGLAERVRAVSTLIPRIVPPPPQGPVPLELPFIGREAESAAIGATSAALLLVQGEAGVGKTRLVQESLRASSTLAVYCDRAARQAALYPVAEALQAALASPQRAARLATVPPAQRLEAARLLPALAGGPGGPAPDPVTPAEPATDAARRERFLDALADVIDAVAGPGGTCWIDDLQWADEATLGLVVHLAQRRGREAARHVRLVAALRTPGSDTPATVDDTLRRLHRARLLEMLPLAPFAPAQTLDLLRAVSGLHGGDIFAARLQRTTGGNAFHLAETLRHLLDSGEVQVRADGRWCTRHDEPSAAATDLPLPPTLAAVALERVARLSAPARQLVEAAVHTRGGFTLAQLRPATALGDWDALDGLEEALRAGLFSEWTAHGGASSATASATAPPRYRLAHELVREALRPTIRPERRLLIHDRLARVLIAQDGAPDHIAWHLEEAGRADEALDWRLAAADHARSLTSWRDALAQLNLAWPAARGDAGLRLRIVRERFDAARCCFDLAAMEAAVDDFDALAGQAGSPAWRLEACVLRAELAQLRKSTGAAIAPLQAALGAVAADATVAPSLKARALAALGHALLAGGQVEAARRALAGFDAEDPRIGPRWRAALLGARANAARLSGQAACAQTLFEQAIALLQAPAHIDARLSLQNLLAHTHFMQGLPDQAMATLEDLLRQAEQARLTLVLRTVLPNLATLALSQGQVDRARRYLEHSMRALRGVDDQATQAMLSSRLADLQLSAGELGAALVAAGRSIEGYEANRGGSQDYAPWFIRFHILRHAGRPPEAARVFQDLLQSPARAPGAGPEALARLMSLVARLPAASGPQARSIAAGLQRLRQAPDGAFTVAEVDFWRAHALQQAGAHAQAATLAASLPTAQLGLQQHPATLLALRLVCGKASGRLDPALLGLAEAMLDTAPALARLDLMRALMQAHEAGSPQARVWKDRLATWVRTLAASLAAEPALAAGLRQRWQA